MRIIVKIIIYITIISLFSTSSVYSSQSAELCGYIDRVVDGDTIWMDFVESYKDDFRGFLEGSYKIRFADVNAPEISTVEGVESREALLSLISKYGNFACINVDDKYVFDRYDRIVALVYLPFNNTHFINVNRYMVDNGYAIYVDYPNEFSPDKMPLYIKRMGGSTSLFNDYLPLILLLIIVLLFIVKRSKIGL